MAALQHATAATEVATFLACCDDVVRKGTQTLSTLAVAHRLQHLESEWAVLTSSISEQAPLTVSARVQALQHYYDVYDVCARTVPLPPPAWERWVTVITTAFAVPDASAASQLELEAKRATLILKYWALYGRVHWGCACSAKARLAFAAEEARMALETAPLHAQSGEVKDEPTKARPLTVEELERTLAAPLHAFAKLAHDMTHLFGDYAVVGAVERQWLNEDVLEHLGDAAENAVEALVRRSYKRDVQIPSSSLPAVLEEYEENEVEERKAKEIIALGNATLKSSWMRAAVALQQHLVSLTHTTDVVRSSTSDAAADAGDAVAVRPLPYDSKAYELLEELLKELRKAPHSQGSLAALGLLTHRVVEWQPLTLSSSSLSAPTGISALGLNGSQTQFYLFLLHQWLARYIASQHRWTVTDMFSASDDSDLWSFVLDRHSFCLMWALTTFDAEPLSDTTAHTATTTTTSRLKVDARRATTAGAKMESTPQKRFDGRQLRQEAFQATMESKIDKLRAIFYSVAHCLQLYRRSVLAFTNPEKRALRLATAQEAVHAWMQRVGVSTFCRGLLGDLLDTTEEWEDADAQTPALQLWTLRAEAELKLIMYDTMSLLGCPDNTTERLETLITVALDLCTSWKEQLAGQAKPEESSEDATALFAPVVALFVRVVHRLRAALQRSCEAATELSTRDAEQYLKLVGWIRQLLSVTSAYVDAETLDAVWDEYMLLLSLPAPAAPLTTPAGAEDGHVIASPSASLPGFVSYLTSTTKRAFGAPSPASGGLDNLCWERRNAFKSRREEEERRHGLMTASLSDLSSNQPTNRDQEGLDESLAKRQRTE